MLIFTTIDADGGAPRRLTTETFDDVAPSWSNDGRWIYFASNRTGRSEVWRVPADGRSAVQVTKQGGFAAFESPDGRFVYYAKGLNVSGLWRVASAAGEEVPVLEFPKAAILGLLGRWRRRGIYFVNTVTRPIRPRILRLRHAPHQRTSPVSNKSAAAE